MLAFFFMLLSSSISLEENLLWPLNPENIALALEYQPRMLVFFYSSTSEDSQKLYTEAKFAASKLNSHHIRIGSIDCESFPSLCSDYLIDSTPQYIYFDTTDHYKYTGPTKGDEIAKWVIPRFQSSLEHLKPADDILTLFKSNRISFLYLGNDTTIIKTLKELSVKFIDIKFYVSGIQDTKDILNSPSNFVLHKGGEFSFYTGEKDPVELEKFLEKNKPAQILQFNEDSIKLVFDQKKTTLFLFRKELDKKKHEVDFGKIADRYHGRFVFISADLSTKGKNTNKLAHALGLNPNTQPLAVLLNIKEVFYKYRTAEIDFSGLNDFINSFYTGTLLPYYKSEAIEPEMLENNVLRLVGLNHEEVVQDPSKDVLALYFTVQHPESSSILPVFEKLALNYETLDDMLLVKMDIVYNEAKGLVIPQLPLIKFYPKHNKSGIPYSGDLTLFGLQKFVAAYYKPAKSEL